MYNNIGIIIHFSGVLSRLDILEKQSKPRMDILVGDGISNQRPTYGSTPQTLPDSLLKCRVVIVGGGPCGLFAATVLHQQGFRDITLLERLPSASPSSSASQRSYVFSLNIRGQAVVSSIAPELFEHLKGYTSVPDGYLSCDVLNDGTVRCLDPRDLFRNFKPGMLLYRPCLIESMFDFLPDSVNVRFECTVTDVAFNGGDGTACVEFVDGDKVLHVKECDLLIACDGVNSSVVKALAENEAKVKSKHGFAHRTLTSYAVGLRTKSIIVSESILNHLLPKGVPVDFGSTHWVSIKGNYFRMAILPMLRTTRDTNGGLLATVVGKWDHDIWNIQEDECMDEAYAYFESNFEQLNNIREYISVESMRDFITGKFNTFPLIKQPKSLCGTFGSQGNKGAVIILGDAAHSVPPDMGQGLNASLEDVATLQKCLQRASDVEQVAWMYQKERAADVKGLVELCSFSGQAQNPKGAWRRSLDRRLREWGAARLPSGWIYPPTIDMLSKCWSYGVVRRRYRVTTLRLFAVFFIIFILSVVLVWWVDSLLMQPSKPV